MQIGFIGIGVMGRPMTLNLLKAEHHVTIYARHPQKPEVQEVLGRRGEDGSVAASRSDGLGHCDYHAAQLARGRGGRDRPARASWKARARG